MTQPCYSPDLEPCDFWLLPNLKSPLKGKIFQTINEIQENTVEELMGIGELCEVSRCLLWRRLRHHCLMFNKCLYFSYYMAGYPLSRFISCVWMLSCSSTICCKTIFDPLYCVCFSVKDLLTIFIWVYFWVFPPVPLIYFSILSSISHYLYDYIIAGLKVGHCQGSYLTVPLQVS